MKTPSRLEDKAGGIFDKDAGLVKNLVVPSVPVFLPVELDLVFVERHSKQFKARDVQIRSERKSEIKLTIILPYRFQD